MSMVTKLIITFLVWLNVSFLDCGGGLFTAAAAVFHIHRDTMIQLHSEVLCLTDKNPQNYHALLY